MRVHRVKKRRQHACKWTIAESASITRTAPGCMRGDKARFFQEGITGTIGKLYETEPLVGIVPFDDRLDRGTGGCFKPLGAGSRCRSEAAPGCLEVVVVEATATGRTKISISAAHWSSWVE